MKKNSYIILALAGMFTMNSCNDDEFLPGNPSMEIKAENADALFGDSLPFTIKASDVDVPLSTLKAQLFMEKNKCLKRSSVQRQAEMTILVKFLFLIMLIFLMERQL